MLKIIRIEVFAILFLAIVSIHACSSSDPDIVTGLYYADYKPVEIIIKEGMISEVKRITSLPKQSPDLFIAPGFIDNQVNGFAGVSFTFGGGELTAQGVKNAANELWKTGVTTFIPTLTTNSKEILLKNFSVLAGVIDDSELLGSIPGFHLEGPYISPVDGFRGAHPLSFVRKPDWNEFLEFNKAAGNKILEVTIAPETEGAMDFISRCKNAGIIVGLGHHNADAKTVTEAIGITDEYSDMAIKRLGILAEKHHSLAMYHTHQQPAEPGFSFDTMFTYSPANYLNLDAGHYYGATGLHPNDIIIKYHEKMRSIHIKDKTGPKSTPPGTNMPFGKGETPIADILLLLKKEKWPINVDIELEYPIPEGSDAAKEVAICIEYMRNILE